MNKVIFTGYYGMQNYGDDLFSIISDYGARQYWKDHQPSILSPPIKGADAKFYIPGVVSKDIYSSETILGKFSRTAPAVMAALSTDKMIFSGGSLFTSQQSGVRKTLATISKYKANFFSGIGVSIGPFNSVASEKNIQEFLKRFEFISVRDSTSFDIAKDFNLECPVNLSRDLAGLTNFIIPQSAQNQSDHILIGYSPCNISGNYEKSNKINELIASALALLSKELNLKVKIINLNSNKDPNYSDEELSRFAERKLQSHGIKTEYIEYSDLGALNTWGQIAQCNAYISTRLHGAITAYLNNTPFTLVEYHNKCTDFLNDIGQSDNVRVKSEEWSVQDYCDTFRTLISNHSPPTLPPNIYSIESTTNFTCAPWASITAY